MILSIAGAISWSCIVGIQIGIALGLWPQPRFWPWFSVAAFALIALEWIKKVAIAKGRWP